MNIRKPLPSWLKAEWHPKKNRGLSADDVGVAYPGIVWWQCRKDARHAWQTSVLLRATGRGRASRIGCPFCEGRRPGFGNALADRHPDVAAQWHPRRNGALRPQDVLPGSNKKVWWLCPRGVDHEWCTTVTNRATQGRGCPYCAGKRISVTNSLATLFPAVARQWHRTRNGALTPRDVIAGSHRRAWWKCPKGPDHEWSTIVQSRTQRGVGCPFCSGKQVSRANNLAARFPRLAAEWHPSRNGKLRPTDLTAYSQKSVWWQCRQDPRHAWKSKILNRSTGRGCPFCANQRFHPTNALAVVDRRVARMWHPTRNAPMTPRDIVHSSNRRFWWKCPKGPDHEWQAVLSAMRKSKHGCPFCNGKRASITNNLATRLPAIAKLWHPTRNAPVTPRDVTYKSNKRFWWKCPKGPDHEWQTTVAAKKTTRPCPFCNNRRLSVTNSLATRYPKIAKLWHPTRNGRLTADQVIYCAERSAYWMCHSGHETRALVKARVEGAECRICFDQRFKRHGKQAMTVRHRKRVWLPSELE